LTKPGRRVELFFLVVGLVAGAAFAVLFPPFSIADEPSHFLRAFHVSSGRLVPERTAAGMGAVLPASLPRLADELAGGLPFNHQLKVDPRIVLAALRRPLGEERQFVDFRNAAFASALPYVPQAAGIALGRSLGAPPLRLLLDDAIEHSLRYLAQLIGVLLGWLDARVPWWVIYTYLVTLALLTVTDVDPEHVPSPRRRLLLAVVVMTTLVSIAASQYAAWTPYRAPFIEGIQGRYFLPVAPAAALLFQSRRGAGRLALDRLAVWLAAASVIGLAAGLAAVAGRYY
jgi:predicted membrane protein DUF2142